MDISPESTLLSNLQPEDFASYLKLIGWNATDSSSGRWRVFLGAEDAYGEPLELVLPKNQQSLEARMHIAGAVNLISALSEEAPEIVVDRIKFYEYDLLKVHNLETGRYHSLPIQLAAQQVQAMKRLVAFSACSEEEPRTHFTHYQFKRAKEMLEHYRFGQTFPGSFGYTIESKIVREPFRYVQKRIPIFEDGHDQDEDDAIMLPIERRVMERIMRGLASIQEVENDNSTQALVEQYQSGLNANMCEALVEMSDTKDMPIECSVLWSPKIKPSKDTSTVKSVLLNSEVYRYLERAAEQLRDIEPSETTIMGRVTDLSASDNPLGNPDVRRSVVIKWTYRPSGRPLKVVVSLEKADYIAASEAHMNWSTVQVTGFLQRVGNIWKLAKAHDFKVIQWNK